MEELDTPTGRMSEDAEQRFREQLAAHQREVRKALTDLLAAGRVDTPTDNAQLVETCSERVPDDKASAWGLAVLAFEDRAVQLAENWLQDPKLDPAQHNRVSELLSGLPGYRATRGLDDEVLEQAIIDQHEHEAAPRTVALLLCFVLSILILSPRQDDVSYVLNG